MKPRTTNRPKGQGDTMSFEETRNAMAQDAGARGCNIAFIQAIKLSRSYHELSKTLKQSTGVGSMGMVERWARTISELGKDEPQQG